MIDRQLAKYGYIKIEENKYGTTYEKQHVQFNYFEILTISHKANNKHIIQSYEKDKLTTDGYTIMVGIEAKAIKWICLKYLYLRLRYKWK